MKIKLIYALVSLIAICSIAKASTILDGNWYWVSGTNTSDSSVNESSGSLQISFPTRTNIHSGLVLYFPKISLVKEGDSVVLTFSLTTPSVSFPGGGWGEALYYGLYDSNGDQLTANATTWGSSTGDLFTAYSGYTTRGSVGNTASASIISFQKRPDNSGFVNLLFGATTIDSTNYTNGTVQTNSTNTFSLTLTRTSSGLSHTIVYADTSFSGFDSDPVTYEFDTFLLGFYQQAFANGSVFTLDNVSVLSIPEPKSSVAALLGTGLIATLLARARRKL